MLDIVLDWTRFTNSITDLITPISDTEAQYIEMAVDIVPDWNTSVYLEWESPETLDISVSNDDVQYMVYTSNAEAGPFTSITSHPIRDTNYFTTWQTQESKVHEQFFTIELLYPDGTVYRSTPQSPMYGLPKWHRLRQKDIIRRESILLEKFVGIPSIVYTPKTSGLRCKKCWDKTHLKVTNDHCDTCYGTGYQDGYSIGMKTLMQYTSIDPQKQYSYNGTNEPIMISAWTISYPLIPPHSIILRLPDRKVFRCEGHQGSTEMRTTVQRQNVVLKELSRDSVENKLFNRKDFVEIMPRQKHVHH